LAIASLAVSSDNNGVRTITISYCCIIILIFNYLSLYIGAANVVRNNL
jgi:hypothetical protein